MFSDWGYSSGFCLVIGILELIGAIGILFARTSIYASYGLFGLMIGAIITHAINDPFGQILRPFVFMLLLVVNWHLTRRTIDK